MGEHEFNEVLNNLMMKEVNYIIMVTRKCNNNCDDPNKDAL